MTPSGTFKSEFPNGNALFFNNNAILLNKISTNTLWTFCSGILKVFPYTFSLTEFQANL